MPRLKRAAALIIVLVGPGGPGGQALTSPAAVTFVDATEAAGIHFVHNNGGTGRKHLPETMGSGVVWLDHDGDGKWDLYFVDSGALPDASRLAAATAGQHPVRGNVLYRGRGDGTFAPAPGAGAADTGYGMGATVADYDGDGWADLLVTNFGANALYRNNGDGTFSDVTATAGVGDRRWGTSAAWADLDADGFADLHIVNYVSYDAADAPSCRDRDRGIQSYCHIDLFEGEADLLYRNNGDGTFADITVAAGVANSAEGKGLGVVMGDVNDDGLLDIYVANDTARNFLYLNRGGLRFEDTGLVAGVGYSDSGLPQAGMGADLGDLDGDGRSEIVVTNFDSESNNLYRTHGTGFYLDDAYPLGLGEPSFPLLGFGVVMIDLDGDGDLDLAVANGHILEAVERLKDNINYAQPNQVFRNRLTELRAAALQAGELPAPDLRSIGAEPPSAAARPVGEPVWRPQHDLLMEVSAAAGLAITRERVSRGLAVGDADSDGWPDLALTNSNGPAELLRNTTAATHQRLVLRLRGRGANRDALGAKVWVTPLPHESGREVPASGQGGASGDRPGVRGGNGAVGFPQTFEIKSASSYLSQNATDLYVGLGSATAAAIEIRWPGGELQRLEPIASNQLVLIVQGRGVVASTTLQGR